MTNAGWHPDPLERHQLRYFDGEQWTPHVVDGNNLSFDALAPSTTPEGTRAVAASDTPREAGTPARTRRVQWLVLAGIVVLVGAATLGTVAFANSPSTGSATVHGSFAIQNAAGGPPPYARDGRGRCTGGSRLRDVNARTRVVIADNHGNEVARTVLGTGHTAGDGCVFRFTFTVEKGEAYYVVSVGNRSVGAYSFAQLEQHDAVALVI
jgi:hypothetical protein